MKHYICKGGCMGVSENPGTCEAKGCPSYNMPLEECDCTDRKHYNRQNSENKDEISKKQEAPEG